MNLTTINILNQPARERKPAPTALDARIAKIERYLAEMAAFAFTTTYREAVAELSDLRLQAHAAEVASNAGVQG